MDNYEDWRTKRHNEETALIVCAIASCLIITIAYAVAVICMGPAA